MQQFLTATGKVSKVERGEQFLQSVMARICLPGTLEIHKSSV